MATKLVGSIEDFLKYANEPGDTGTTQEQFQEFLRNIYGVIGDLVNSAKLWQPETSYSVGDIVISPSMVSGLVGKVTVAGETGANEPEWGKAGTEVSSNTVKFVMAPMIADSYLRISNKEPSGTIGQDVWIEVLDNIAEKITKGIRMRLYNTDKKAYEVVHPETETARIVDWADKEKSLKAYVDEKVSGSGSSIVAALPTFYNRTALPTPNKVSITIHPTVCIVNGRSFANTSDVTLSLKDVVSVWDDNNYSVAANRAGKDFYIYAYATSSGMTYVLSANSTVPTGDKYTATNTRKIGGFHCLCADVGAIEGHALSGYVAGDILPASVWDLLHRCKGENEGMVYDADDDVWIGIYLLSYDNGKAVSRYNGVILDGESTPKTHGLWFTETLAKQKMRLPYLHEFFTALKGCQEQVNISGSKDWNTTGGHVYTNNVRCISNIGLEDPTGFMWQWSNNYGMSGGSSWGQSSYDSQIDSVNRGGTYGNLWLPHVGGRWADGSDCGSRSVSGSFVAAHRAADRGARPASEPRVVIL